MLFGAQDKIFFQFHTKALKVSPVAVEKTKAALEKFNKKPPTFPHPKMKAWWKKRYILFDKFDQGIKFDE